MINKFGSFQNTARNIGNITGVTISVFLRNEAVFMRIYHLFRLTDSIDIPKSEVEKHIDSFKDYVNGTIFNANFPIKFTPLLLRVIAHMVGDGSTSSNMLRWIQLDVSPLQNLIKQILGVDIKESCKYQLTIPAFLGKIICTALNINSKDIKSPLFIEKVTKLPRPFKIQLLLAIIDDEGTIEENSINIRMADKKLLSSIRELTESLNLDVSKIGESINNGSFGNKKSKIFRFRIRADGLNRLMPEVNTLSNFGLPGLIVKHSALNRHLWRTTNDRC